jgi:hypothetical protein
MRNIVASRTVGILERIPKRGYGRKCLPVQGKGWSCFKEKGWGCTKPEDIPDEEMRRICVNLGLFKEFKYVEKGGLWIGEGVATSILDAYEKSSDMRDVFPTRLDKLLGMIDAVLKYVILGQCHDMSRTTRKEEITQQDTYAHLVATYGFYGLLEEIARLNHKTEAIKVFNVINSQGEFKDEQAEPLLQMLREFKKIEEDVATEIAAEEQQTSKQGKISEAKRKQIPKLAISQSSR